MRRITNDQGNNTCKMLAYDICRETGDAMRLFASHCDLLSWHDKPITLRHATNNKNLATSLVLPIQQVAFNFGRWPEKPRKQLLLYSILQVHICNDQIQETGPTIVKYSRDLECHAIDRFCLKKKNRKKATFPRRADHGDGELSAAPYPGIPAPLFEMGIPQSALGNDKK